MSLYPDSTSEYDPRAPWNQPEPRCTSCDTNLADPLNEFEAPCDHNEHTCIMCCAAGHGDQLCDNKCAEHVDTYYRTHPGQRVAA